MKRRHWLLAALLVLVALAGLAFWGARAYLGSPYVAAEVAERLQGLVGGPVRVGRLQVGLNNSTVVGVQLYDPAEPEAPPWLTAEEVETDIPIAALARGGAKPRHVTVKGAVLVLRFDRDGHLLTHLPQPRSASADLPDVQLEGARLTLRQEGRPDFILQGVDAGLSHNGSRLGLTGSVADPVWGKWALKGDLDDKTQTGSASLRTETVHVTPALLQAVPLVDPAVWREVGLEGDTPMELTLRSVPGEPRWLFRVAAEPRATKVHISSIDLDADQAQGRVVVDRGVVTLSDVGGRTAGGELATNATLDFRGPASKLTFKITARQLDVSRLPKSWSLPPQITGKLSGEANLTVLVQNGQTSTNGSGRGTITEARIAGFPADPIQIRLHPAGRGFRFASETPAAGGSGAQSALSSP